MNSSVTITVLGSAVAKGNMKAFPFQRRDGSLGAAVTEGTKHSGDWARSVRVEAEIQARGVFFDGAVRVGIVFYLPRPKSLPRKVTQHLKKPDIDKLTRNCLDALKGVLWNDDSQVVALVARKVYATGQPQAHITVASAEAFSAVEAERDLFAPLEEARA